MIFAIVLLSISIILLSLTLIFTRIYKSNGELYFHEEDNSMYLQLNNAEIPKRGYVTLKIRRL